jgi:hypothetical protein
MNPAKEPDKRHWSFVIQQAHNVRMLNVVSRAAALGRSSLVSGAKGSTFAGRWQELCASLRGGALAAAFGCAGWQPLVKLLAMVWLLSGSVAVSAEPVGHSHESVAMGLWASPQAQHLGGGGPYFLGPIQGLNAAPDDLLFSEPGGTDPPASFTRLASTSWGQNGQGQRVTGPSAQAGTDAGQISLPGTLVLVGLALALLWGTPLTASLQRWLRRTFNSGRPDWRAVSRF